MERLGERLKFVREKLGKSQDEMAGFLGLKYQSTYGNYERNLRELPYKVINVLIEMGVNTNWLFSGSGEPFVGSNGTKITKDDEYFEIPVMANVGAGEVFEDDIPKEDDLKIMLPRRPFKGEIAFQVRGDSMETTLYDGDYITAVRIPLMRVRNNMDYLIISEFGAQIKKVTTDGVKIILISRNPKYSGEQICPTHIVSTWEIITKICNYRVPEESDTEKVLKIIENRNS